MEVPPLDEYSEYDDPRKRREIRSRYRDLMDTTQSKDFGICGTERLETLLIMHAPSFLSLHFICTPLSEIYRNVSW